MFPKEILRGLPSGRVLDPVQGGHSLRGAGSGWTHGQATESCLGGEGGGGEALGGRRDKEEYILYDHIYIKMWRTQTSQQ